jgi:hypothetical protein
MDKLLPLIDAEEGYIPEVGFGFDIMRPQSGEGPRNGAAFVQIAPETGMSRRPYVMCVGCWQVPMSRDAWSQVRQLNATQRAALASLQFWKPIPQQRPPVPWLAVVITPFMMTLDEERIRMLGDMERCLFWALAEGS